MKTLDYINLNFLFVSDSPLKLTKRWRKNHEEEQMQKAEIEPDPNRPNILDLTFNTSSCNNATSIVNWLNQTSSISLSNDYLPVSSEISSLTDHSLSSPTSISSSNTDDEPFNYLYLLASAAVERIGKNDQVTSNLELTIKT